MPMNAAVDLAKPYDDDNREETFEDIEAPTDCNRECCDLSEKPDHVPTAPGVVILIGRKKTAPLPRALYIKSTNRIPAASLRIAYKYIQKNKEQPWIFNGLFQHYTDVQFCYYLCKETNVDDFAELLVNTYHPVYSKELLTIAEQPSATWS